MNSSSPTICVVGSSNIDQIAYTDRVPESGETLIGKSFEMGFGGKGANQAIMAGILGADTYMITCLGDDPYAEMTIENYKKAIHITKQIGDKRHEGVFLGNLGNVYKNLGKYR